MATITCYELATYNNGEIKAFEIDLDTISSYEEFQEAVTEKLETLGGEKYIITDWEDIPDKYVEEYFDYKEAVEEHGEEVVDAAVELEIDLDNIDYCGEYEGTDDQAIGEHLHQLAEECGELNGPYSDYIDWEAVGRDARYSGEYEAHNGHVFRMV